MARSAGLDLERVGREFGAVPGETPKVSTEPGGLLEVETPEGRSGVGVFPLGESPLFGVRIETARL